LSHSSSPFGIGYFWDRVLFYAWASLDHDPTICTSLPCWDDRHVLPHPAIGWDGVSRSLSLSLFFPILNWNVHDLHLWVAKIIGLSHCAQTEIFFLLRVILAHKKQFWVTFILTLVIGAPQIRLDEFHLFITTIMHDFM
jgi:hypothetical protein